MDMRFSEEAFQRSRIILLGPQGNDLIRLMADISLGADITAAPSNLLEVAQTLGWLTVDRTPTPHGYCAADSCREYRFWLERDRRLPFQPAADHLKPEHFSGKSVIEIGCGAGVNLMSLQPVAKAVTGIEVIEIYTQMGRIFCEKEGLVAPKVISCPAEHIDSPDSCYDTALCVAAIHYFDIVPALREISRVLRPCGELLIVGWSFGNFLDSFRPNKFNSIALINSLGYMALKKRPIPPLGTSNSTSRAIFPTIAAVSRWMANAGLDPLEPIRTGEDWCLRGRKPQGQT